MADSSLSKRISRRNFLISGAAPLALGLLPGCRTLESVTRNSSARPVSSGLSDHPLTALTFSGEDIVTPSMTIRAIDTPVLFSEGIDRWQVRGVHPYLYLLPNAENDRMRETPPTGIRSAVPLGGLGAGALELRADGRLADWQIFNNSPGDGDKVHLDEAFFALRTRRGEAPARTFTLRTHPPDTLTPVSAIGYSGSFPVSRLRISDPGLPLGVEMYGYGSFDMDDASLSNIPAVVFSFILSNPTSFPIEASLMFAMPNYLEGTYRSERGLLLSRSGQDAASGELCIAFASEFSVSSIVTSTLKDLWGAFEKAGTFEGHPSMGLFEYGALATRFVVEPGASRAVSMVLSWYFPHRFIAGRPVGNRYTRRFRSATEVNDTTVRRLPEIWKSLQTWQTLCTQASLPDSVQQELMNSLAQLYKTTFISSDGDWAAWDSLANPTLSTLRSQLYRALPLLFFAPDGLRSYLRALATHQDPAGRIPSSLGRGARYAPGSAPPSSDPDAIPIFFILAYLFYRHTGERAFIQELWPHLTKALAWQHSITTPDGLPSNFSMFGDWESMGREGVNLSDAVLQIAGYSAILRMAEAIDRSAEMTGLSALVGSGARAIETKFWTGDGYRSVWRARQPSNDHYEPGDLLGFIGLFLVDTADLLAAERIARHLGTVKDRSMLSISSQSNGFGDGAPGVKEVVSTGAVLDWAALNLWAAGSADASLDLLDRFCQHQIQTLHDPWGQFETFSGADGKPWSNPRHVTHLGIWHLILALSGQHYDASRRRLTFTPRLGGRSRYPFFTHEAQGILHHVRSGDYELQVLAGRLQLNEIVIGSTLRYRDVRLEAGQVLQMRS